MKNNLTQSQKIRIGFWALVLIITSIANVLTYHSIMAHFNVSNVSEVIVFYIIVAAQFISLMEIYLITLEKTKRKRRSRR